MTEVIPTLVRNPPAGVGHNGLKATAFLKNESFGRTPPTLGRPPDADPDPDPPQATSTSFLRAKTRQAAWQAQPCERTLPRAWTSDFKTRRSKLAMPHPEPCWKETAPTRAEKQSISRKAQWQATLVVSLGKLGPPFTCGQNRSRDLFCPQAKRESTSKCPVCLEGPRPPLQLLTASVNSRLTASSQTCPSLIRMLSF